MFIALIGTRFAGKLTVKDYLVKQQGFIPIRINQLTKNVGNLLSIPGFRE